MRPFLFFLAMLSMVVFLGRWQVNSIAAEPKNDPILPASFLKASCANCHTGAGAKGGFNLADLKYDNTKPEHFARWAKVFDRVHSGEMPPKDETQPDAETKKAFLNQIKQELQKTEQTQLEKNGRMHTRRMNRIEFENTLRDLFDLPGLRLTQDLPADGKAHGFDRSTEALDFSFVHMETYLAAVDFALNEALPAFTEKPETVKYRYRPWDGVRHNGKEIEGALANIGGQKNIVPLIGLDRDPTFEVIKYTVKDDEPKATAIGFYRHEDADFRFSLTALSPVVTGLHKLRVSGYSFAWDGKKVVATDRSGAIGVGVHNSGLHFGTKGVPANKAGVAEFDMHLRRHEGHIHGSDNYLRIIFASCENVRDFKPTPERDGPNHPAPGIAIEWIEFEGPIFEQWPPKSQKTLFGDLPVQEWTKESGVPMPTQQKWPKGNHGTIPKDPYGENGRNRKPVHVVSADPEKDSERLVKAFLPKAFRRPVTQEEVNTYTKIASDRRKAGDHFQDALKAAYRAALVSPDFMLLKASNSEFSLASRLSYLLWSGPPDPELFAFAEKGELSKPDVLRGQVARLLKDPKSARFLENFTGQWLRLRELEANPPDRQLYPEFMPYLQESMGMETRAYFTELLKNNLSVTHFVKSDFLTINEPLARHYGIQGVTGYDIQKVKLPKDSLRGGFLTQASILKVTANGTTTSPVPRGAFVMEKILGITPTPPPPDVGSIEPDTRGATTIREQLEKHKKNAVCASCHIKMDPYGFALESFDVIGEYREKYRVRGGSGKEPVKKIVNNNGVSYQLANTVDCAGQLPDGKAFKNIAELRELLASNEEALARAFVGHLVTYGTGTPVLFTDRGEVDGILQRAKPSKYGVQSLLTEMITSRLFLKP